MHVCRQAAPNHEASMKVLIVSNEPELYRISFFDVLNQAVHVTDQAVKGLALMNSHAIDKVFVSYAQMDNKWNDRAWSGQTFVRELCARTSFPKSNCFYLATGLPKEQKAWIREKQGVGGVLGKSPLDISAAAFHVHFKDGSRQLFADINRAFTRFAGPLGGIVLSSLLPRMSESRSVSMSSYIQLLANNLHLSIQRKAFVAEVSHILNGQRT